ncbi:hypothetical protein ACFLUA_05110, partial [Chloroflexota bacterium]
FDPVNPPPYYQKAADYAFQGIPSFPKSVVINPKQWSLTQRSQRHLVIKEVNPYAISWYTQFYKPRIIYLIRHPAAVALSYKKLNWWPDMRKDFFSKHGLFQAEALEAVLNCIKYYEDVIIIKYENICKRPHESFRNLFSYTDLIWDDVIYEMITNHTSGIKNDLHWTTYRDSKTMIQLWKNQLSEKEIKNIKDSYCSITLPWYQSPEDW